MLCPSNRTWSAAAHWVANYEKRNFRFWDISTKFDDEFPAQATAARNRHSAKTTVYTNSAEIV
jgi:hypothetical protein